MKKRFVVLICALCAVMAAFPVFAACGGDTDNDGTPPSYSVSFEQPSMTLEVGETKNVVIDFSGGDVVNVKVEPASVASYSEGRITGLKAGTAVVTASIGDKSATMSLTVTEKPIEKVSVTVGDDTQLVAIGSYLPRPITPKKEATVEKEYAFDGWYIAGTDTKWDFATDTVQGAMTLEARFTESPRMYYVQIGTDFVEGYYGQVLAKPADPVKEDEGEKAFAFDGWYVKGTDTKWNFETDVVNGDGIVLVARFTETIKQYTYRFVIESQRKEFMGVECALFDISDEDVTAVLAEGDKTTPLEVKNGVVTLTAPRGTYEVRFTYKNGDPIVKKCYLQSDGEAKVKIEQQLKIGGNAGDLASFGDYTYENGVLTIRNKAAIYVGGEQPTDTLYMEANVQFKSGVGKMAGFMPAAEHKSLEQDGKKLAFSYSGLNRLYYSESTAWGGEGITPYDAFISNTAVPLTNHKMSVARVGNEYYVFLQDKLFAYYVSENFGAADFGFVCAQTFEAGKEIEIVFSDIAYTTKEANVKAIVEKNGGDKKFYKNNNSYIGGSIQYPAGKKYASFGANWALTGVNSGYMTKETYIYATNQMASVYYQEAEFEIDKGWVGLLVNTLDGQPSDNKGWYGYGIYHDPSWAKSSGTLYLHQYKVSWNEGTQKKSVDLGSGDTFKLGVARINNMYYVYINDKLVLEETLTVHSTANNSTALASDNPSGFGLFRGGNFGGNELYFENYEYTTDVSEIAKKVGGTATVTFDDSLTMTQNGRPVTSGEVLVPGIPVIVSFALPEGKVVKSYSLTRDGKNVDLTVSGTDLVFTPSASGSYVATASYTDAGTSTIQLTVKPVQRKAGDSFYSLYDMNIDYTKVNVSVLNFTTANEQTFNMSSASQNLTVNSGYCKITVTYNGIVYSEYVVVEANSTIEYVGYVSDAYLGGKINNSTGEHLSFDKANVDATSGSNWSLVDGRRDTVRVTNYTYAYQNGVTGNKYYVEGTFDSNLKLSIGGNFGGLLVSHGPKDLNGDGDAKFEVTIMGQGIFAIYMPSGWSPANIFSIGNYADKVDNYDPSAVRLGVLRDGINYYFFVNDVYIASYVLPQITFAESGIGVVANAGVDVTISNFNYTKSEEFINALKATVPQEDKKIDVYLIAGQSNASGCTNINVYEAAETDPHYLAGYNNIYYMGSAGANWMNKKDFGLSRAGLGENNGRIGPELGMAKGLSAYYNEESGKKAVMIKYAVGGTNLQDAVGGLNSSDGNWCPPTWLEQHGKVNSSLSGGLFDKFMKEFTQRWQELKAMGYQPEVKGLYWMQGEADKGSPDTYAKIFKVFASDFRNSITEISGQDCSNMPIFIGEIAETSGSADAGTVAINKAFIAMQNKLTTKGDAKYVENTYIIKSGTFPINALNSNGTSYAVGSDSWHWKWQDAITIGKLVGESIIQNVLSK